MRFANAKLADRLEILTVFGGAALLLVVFSYFYFSLYQNYVLVGDDPGNVGGTLQNAPLGWLTNGLRDYYHAYPEWKQDDFSNFYRPFWNVIIYAEHSMFGDRFSLWFFAFFVAQFLGMLLFLKLLHFIDVPRGPSALFAILFLLNPAFICFGLVFPGFQFDVFASLLLLISFFLLLKGRHGAALACVAAAVFTKETALFAPMAAALSVYVLRRDLKWATLMLMPLLVWVAARYLAYGEVIGGTFDSPTNMATFLIGVAKGVMIWPSGAVSVAASPSAFSLSGVTPYVFVVVNAALWAILLYAAWVVVRALRQDLSKPESNLLFVLLIWATGALSFCIIIAHHVRYGASAYMFLLLFFARFLFGRRESNRVRAAVVLILSVVIAWNAAEFMSTAVARTSPMFDHWRAFYEALHALPQDGRVVYVVNAPAMTSAPRYLEKSGKLNLDVVFVNQFLGCLSSERKTAESHVEVTGAKISVVVPSCASMVFTTVNPYIVEGATGGILVRPGVGTYRFPEGRLHFVKNASNNPNLDIGRSLDFRFFGRGKRTILAYDWFTQHYNVIPPVGDGDASANHF